MKNKPLNTRNLKPQISIPKLFYALLLVFFGTFNSCDDDDNLGIPDRLFRPIIQNVTTGGNWIRAEWEKYKNVEYFQLELSVDSFESISVDAVTDTNFYKFENLEYDTKYFLRIKAVGESLESEYFVHETIYTSDFPTKLDPVNKVIDNKALVSWTEVSYDSLVVSRNDTIVTRVVLTEPQKDQKEVVIDGLTEETDYIVKAYYQGNYMGKQAFSTVASPVYEGDVVDLREYDDESAYSLLTQDFFDQMASEYPEGVTIILNGGTEYELTGARLSSSITLTGGLSLEGNAIIRVNGNFDFPSDGADNISKFSFSNITFTDHPAKYRDFGSTYVFNFGKSGHVDSLLFNNCEIRYKRGVIRVKTAATIGTLIMNNCLVDSIGGYGVINLDNGNAGADNIILTNSTFTHVEGYIVRASKTNLQPLSLTVENVTTCFAPNGGKYFFDLDKKTFEDGITIKNCLLGKAWGDEVTVRGLRSNASLISLSQNYKTSDLVWETNEETFTELYPIEASDLGGDIYSVFADPDNNDYTLINNTVKNRAGDPRWW
ncbi:DUF5123 domain-containing protein [Thermophagus sp. OGC60D27]|uniref:DUF5123 domain-containing protein n=1 Tax=Thermophagus sp. OGC60D27 TaxID=3458415 RepID=UPI0040381317